VAGLKRYLLDTNTVSDLVKLKSPKVRKALLAAGRAQICLSVITEAEIHYGLRKKKLSSAFQEAMGQFLRGTEILPWTSKTAFVYGELRANLEARGLVMASMDLLIAAHAIAEGAVLVSSDTAFQRIGGELRVVNWRE
jgi:tRNA(fMet)-specific endonuclease VapC